MAAAPPAAPPRRGGVSACVGPLQTFTPLVAEMVGYYAAQGFAHVYLGLHLQVREPLYESYIDLGRFIETHHSADGHGPAITGVPASLCQWVFKITLR